MILCLGLAAFAANIGLAALIGAFLAGMIVAETKDHTSIEEEVRPLYAFFPPFFFAFIGIELDLGALLNGHALLAAGGDHRRSPRRPSSSPPTSRRGRWAEPKRRSSASAWSPAARSGIVVASIGAAEGVVDAELFAVVVGMAVLTTLIAPFGLRRLSRG